MKKIRYFEVKIRQIVQSIKAIFIPTSYDEVYYEDVQFYVKPSYTGYNIWNLHLKNVKGVFLYRVNGEDLKIIHSFSRSVKVFKKHYKFLKNNWESVDIKNPIGSRLTYINSDDIYIK